MSHLALIFGVHVHLFFKKKNVSVSYLEKAEIFIQVGGMHRIYTGEEKMTDIFRLLKNQD